MYSSIIKTLAIAKYPFISVTNNICPFISITNNICTSNTSGPSMAENCNIVPPTHFKARTAIYPGTSGEQFKRLTVPVDKISWSIEWDDYKPVQYTADSVLKGPVWADLDLMAEGNTQKITKYNQLDGKIDRRSFHPPYSITPAGIPINPVGRTGIIGRGLLGRWGPNHAADPIVTRWKLSNDGGERILKNGKHVLEFVGIQRKDSGEWAIPGGMVEAGDSVSATLKKEFGEEAMNSLEATPEEKKMIQENINALFKGGGTHIYTGYVDDPRNTDNAWMETVAVNFHDELGNAFKSIKLHAGDDAGAVSWIEISSEVKLYASHYEFIKKVAQIRNAHL